jgi:hypothetical protein
MFLGKCPQCRGLFPPEKPCEYEPEMTHTQKINVIIAELVTGQHEIDLAHNIICQERTRLCHN